MSTSETARARIRMALLAVLALSFLCWANAFIEKTTVTVPGGARYHSLFDDAMISMRYAWNFAHGHGLVFNHGERVEGFTNPLMVLVMTLPSLVLNKTNAVLAVQWLGALFLLMTSVASAFVAGRVSRSEDERVRLLYVVAGFALPLAYYPLCYWALEGMETSLVAMLATTGLALIVAHRDSPVRILSLGVVLGLLVATRPDAVVQASLLLFFRAWTLPKERRRLLIAEVGIFIALLAISVVSRALYFKSWVPNTYTLKLVGVPVTVRLLNGIIFVAPFLAQLGTPILWAAAGVLTKRSRLAVAILLLLTSATAYQIWVGGDPWTYWRIMAPYVPLTLLAGSHGLRMVLGKAKLSQTLKLALSGLGLAGMLTIANSGFLSEWTLQELPYLTTMNRDDVAAGIALEQICKPTARIGAFAIGAIGYYSELPVIDFLGKIDPRIANLDPDLKFGFHGLSTVPGHNKYDLHYSIETLRPDYVQLSLWGRQSEVVFVKANYQQVGSMKLLKKSSQIRWDVVNRMRAAEQLP